MSSGGAKRPYVALGFLGLRFLLACGLLLLAGACDLSGADGCDGSGPCGGKQGPLFSLEGAERLGDRWRFDFEPVAVGETLRLPLRIHNEGGAPLLLRLQEEPPLPFSSKLGAIEVQPKGLVSLELAFAPVSVGRFEATLEIWTNVEGGKVERLLLRGSGVGEAGALSVQPTGCLQLGGLPIHERTRGALSLQNLGGVPLEIESLSLASGEANFRLILPPLPPPWTLMPLEEREVLLEYRPTTVEAHDATLVIRSSDPLHPERSVCLTGIGQDRIDCTPSLDFGRVWLGAPQTRSIECRILGDAGEGGVPAYVLRSVEVDGDRFRATIRNPDGSEAPQEDGYLPGDSFLVDVVYEPEAEGLQQGRLLLHSVTDPTVAVSLRAEARASPPCQFALEPSSLHFGVVTMGSERRLPLTIENRLKEGICRLEGLRLDRDSDPAFRPIPPTDASFGPGERLTIEVGFSPRSEERVSGLLHVSLSTEGEEPQTVALSGAGLRRCLHVSPRELDFGSVSPGCASRRQVVSFFNHCDDEVWIDDLWLIDAPGVTLEQDLPRSVPPGGRFEFSLRYEPVSAEALQGSLRIKRRGAVSTEYSLRGASGPEELQTDTFSLAAPQVDVLWVIDNSPIAPAPQYIGRALPALLKRAVELGSDFQLGVTTSGLTPSGSCPGGANGGENGRLFPVDGSAPRILHPEMPWDELEEAWLHNTQVGICHGTEPMYEAAKRALSPPVINHKKVPGTPHPDDGNLGFLRHDAALSIVLVHDEGDQDSPLPVEDYLHFYRGLKPGSRFDEVRVHAISGGKTRGACAASACPRCVDGPEQTGGMWLDICMEWYKSEVTTPAFERLSDALFSFETKLFLRGEPADRNGDAKVDEKDLEVRVGGEVVPAGQRGGTVWRFDRNRNAVVFAPDHRPAVGQPITVEYRKRCSP